MEETGVVTETTGTTAKVSLAKSGACEGCKSSSTCHPGSGENLMEVDNPIGAKVGQHVLLEIESGRFLKATFLVYMVPIALMFLGAYLGGKYGPSIYGGITVDYWQAIGSVFFLALSILGLRLYDKKVRKVVLRPIIVKIIEEGDAVKFH